jgi:ABC-type polysaccharide/polyol phosphate export permease
MIIEFLFDIRKNVYLLVELIKKDFIARYLGSYLGVLWAFIQPMITIMIFWFVFQVGFKSAPVENIPFVLWLVTGILPWFFITDAINSATNSILDNSFLVKKIVFRVSLLPIVKICSSLIVHVFFIGILCMMFIYYSFFPTVYWLQALYYLIASICLILGLSWITSSLVIFLRDIGQVVAMIIQFGFWITPIMWPLKIVPEQYRWWLMLNPAYYIVEGYRDAFINQIWFWQKMQLTIVYWLVVVIVNIVGIVLYKKLRPHFADVI